MTQEAGSESAAGKENTSETEYVADAEASLLHASRYFHMPRARRIDINVDRKISLFPVFIHFFIPVAGPEARHRMEQVQAFKNHIGKHIYCYYGVCMAAGVTYPGRLYRSLMTVMTSSLSTLRTSSNGRTFHTPCLLKYRVPHRKSTRSGRPEHRRGRVRQLALYKVG
jgi:hypothetical protein